MFSPRMAATRRNRLSAAVQTSHGAHPASYIMGTGSFPGIKRPGPGVVHPPHLVPRLKKEWSYTSTPPLGLCGLFWGELTFSSTIPNVALDPYPLPLTSHSSHYRLLITRQYNFIRHFTRYLSRRPHKELWLLSCTQLISHVVVTSAALSACVLMLRHRQHVTSRSEIWSFSVTKCFI